MATSSNVNDDFVIDLSQLWLLLPKQLPGVVSQKWANGHMGRLEPLIPAIYPNGQPLEGIFCRELDNFKIDDRVVFNWKPAGRIEKDKQNQPDAIEAINVEPAPAAQTNALINDYHELVATDLQAQLKRALKQSRDALDNMPGEIEKQAARLIAEKQAELDRLIAEASTRRDELIDQQAQLDEIVRSRVSELLAKRQLELDKAEARLNQRQTDLDTLQANLDNRESDLKALRKKLAEAKAQFEKEGGKAYIEFIRAGAVLSESQVSRLPSGAEEFNPDRINRSLAQRGYRTSAAMISRTVLAALTAWRSGQFVILSGPTGVGKTQLVRQFAQILGAGHAVVAVRPGWVDPSDLLGFYNPMQKLFEPTPFIDQVVEATRWAEANRLFALCLDEMNLSRVENYAADLLSRIERMGANEDVRLDLFSADVAQRMFREHRRLFDSRETLSPDLSAYLDSLTSQVDRYQGRGQLRVPNNLMMFGTVNVDETTHLFSPKFLDRSYVIRFEPVTFQANVLPTVFTGQDIIPIWPLSLESALDITNSSDLPAEAQAAWQDFADWQTRFLASLGVHFGHRFQTSFRRYMAIGHRLGLSNPDVLADEFFLAKIPPRIRFGLEERAMDPSSETKRSRFEQWIRAIGGKYPSLRDSLDQMNTRAPGRSVVEFWD